MTTFGTTVDKYDWDLINNNYITSLINQENNNQLHVNNPVKTGCCMPVIHISV